MTAATESWPGADAAAGTEAPDGATGHTLSSIPDIIAELAGDALELLALESRAAALTLALLVFACVAAACFTLFAWLGLSAIGVVLLVREGASWPVALAALAAVNAALAVGAGMLVRHATRSILFERGRNSRRATALEGR
jgi:uncharacterized membrane protein YqjE